MFKDTIAQRVSDYYAANGPADSQIAHTAAVAAYTRLIAVGNGADSRTADLHEAAAWLHDIGCPEAIRVNGNSLPPNQMREGERIVDEWFSTDTDYPGWNEVMDALSPDERHWLARVVGTHHQKEQALRLHFEPLFEADLIVNIKEGYFGRSQAAHLAETMLSTQAGKKLFGRIVFNK